MQSFPICRLASCSYGTHPVSFSSQAAYVPRGLSYALTMKSLEDAIHLHNHLIALAYNVEA